MGLWQKLFDKSDAKLAQIQTESAEDLHLDLRLREGVTLLASSLINRFAPRQDDSQFVQILTNDLVNITMTDYDGSLQNAQILSDLNKDFLPQPSMLAHWAESKGFEKIAQHNNTLLPQDAADKYILTYYPPAAKSWAKRTGDDISDTSNKHWYSHSKSSLYDSAGNLVGSSNPEAFYNDTQHDATVYVPEDSVSYVIDYKKLNLKREDIADGFKMQNAGMNIMDPKIQQSVFYLQNVGLNNDDIIKLWQTDTDITNAENLCKIENFLQQNGKKEDILKLNLIKSDNKYQYNLQDRSCAIQPTAPILYATAAKIKHENLNQEQANKLREGVGLYNIYDENNYGNINKKFYADYEKNIMKNFKDALLEDVKQLLHQPDETLAELSKNTVNATKWLSAKTIRWAPHAIEIAYSHITDHEQKARLSLMRRMHDDADKFKNLLFSLHPKRLLNKHFSEHSHAENILPETEKKTMHRATDSAVLLKIKQTNFR